MSWNISNYKTFIWTVLLVGIVVITGCGNKEVKKTEISSDQRQIINDLLKNKDYKGLAAETINDIDSNLELRAMYYIASTIQSLNDNNAVMANQYHEKIPVEYKDLYQEIIDNEKTGYEYSLEQDKLKYENKPPVIGMTAEQLKLSSWGLPKDINTTTTENNVSEQWVYGDGKYVYLDNGIVTAIQD